MPKNKEETARDTMVKDIKRGYRKRADADTSHMFSFRLPDALKERIKETAGEYGRSMGEQIITSVEDGLAMQNAIDAVSECLEEFPPPFAGKGWKPSQSECMSFILEAVNFSIGRRRAQLTEHPHKTDKGE